MDIGNLATAIWNFLVSPSGLLLLAILTLLSQTFVGPIDNFVNRLRKTLSVEIALNSPIVRTIRKEPDESIVVLPVGEHVELEHYLLEGEPVKYLHFLLVKVINSGNTPIETDDYLEPLSLEFGRDAQVVRFRTVASPSTTEKECFEQSDANKLVLKKMYLNARDQIAVDIYISQPISEITTDDITLHGRLKARTREIKWIDRRKPQTFVSLMQFIVGNILMVYVILGYYGDPFPLVVGALTLATYLFMIASAADAPPFFDVSHIYNWLRRRRRRRKASRTPNPTQNQIANPGPQPVATPILPPAPTQTDVGDKTTAPAVTAIEAEGVSLQVEPPSTSPTQSREKGRKQK